MSSAHAATLEVVARVSAINANEWDALANPASLPLDPFLSHAFLLSLEESGSATPKTGWAPQFVLMRDQSKSLVSAMPLYLKSHSLGEYVFDHGWANAYERAGGTYYPKLQCAVPFTPVTGRRLLTLPGQEHHSAALLAGARALAEKRGASSVHITFPTQSEWESIAQEGFLRRSDRQFVWRNQGYESFDGFLGALASRKRKAILKERESVREAGISMSWLTGADIKEAHWDAFFAFYMDTGGRKWGTPYLTRTFFSLIGERMAERILLVLCERAGRPIAGALNFMGGDALYGRYWGALEHHACLHFEACYYQAIEFAIMQKLSRVEAGAQGEHKLARGYLPEPVYSLHWLRDKDFHAAVARYLHEERRAVEADVEELSELGPYKHEDPHGL